eukprot:2745966-Rhodomonas_salina.1
MSTGMSAGRPRQSVRVVGLRYEGKIRVRLGRGIQSGGRVGSVGSGVSGGCECASWNRTEVPTSAIVVQWGLVWQGAVLDEQAAR